MKVREIEIRAQALYEDMPNQVKPEWDDCGEATKDVWRERAMDEIPLHGMVELSQRGIK